MLQKNVDWHFNPVAESHHGRVWEKITRLFVRPWTVLWRNRTWTSKDIIPCCVKSNIWLTTDQLQGIRITTLMWSHLHQTICAKWSGSQTSLQKFLIRTTYITRHGSDKFNILQTGFGIYGYGNSYRFLQERHKPHENNALLIVDSNFPRNLCIIVR